MAFKTFEIIYDEKNNDHVLMDGEQPIAYGSKDQLEITAVLRMAYFDCISGECDTIMMKDELYYDEWKRVKASLDFQ